MGKKKEEKSKEPVGMKCYQCPCGSKEFIIGPGKIFCAKCGFHMVFGQKDSWEVADRILKLGKEGSKHFDKANINANMIMIIPGSPHFESSLIEPPRDGC